MIRTEDIMLLCNQGLEMPELKNMIKAAQRKYVNERHTRKIYPLTSGPKKGRWKTYVYIDGKRKEIAGKTEDDVYESLYKHYSSLEESPKTLSDVFELLKDRKLNELARSEKTIREDVRLFNHLSESLRNKDLVEITESDIRKWLVKEYLPHKPREEALKKHLQLLRQIFDYGIHRKICFDNPVKFILACDYANKCALQKKRDEERAFSKKELESIRQDCMMHLKDPFALMMLSADLSSLPTIILRRFLFTNDPAYLLLSVALGDVFLLPPPLLCGILFTLHKKTRKSVPDQSFALSHHTNSSWGATLVSFLMHLPQLLHCYDTGKSDLYQVKPTALF